MHSDYKLYSIKLQKEETMAEKSNVVLATLFIVLGLLVALFVGSTFFPKTVIVENKTVEYVAVPNTYNDSLLSSKVDALSNKVATLDEFEDEADEKLQNDTAKSLVLSKITTRDFKEAVQSELNDENGYAIEDYKNVTVYYTKIESVDLGSDSAEVVVTVKVSSMNDNDEEDSFKVKMTATFLVSGLDVDDIEDAEVEDDFTVVFVKEYD